MSRIILTGGGTGGHVIPILSLLESLKKEGFSCHYIGSRDGIEKELVKDIPYFRISTGKLRRYLSVKNLTDPFKVVKGVGDAIKIMKRINPDVVFSKGGFVTVPVVLAAKILKIPVVIHESDITPGLANKIAIPFAKKVCVSFPETALKLGEKATLTGTPIREEIFKGDKTRLNYSLRSLPTVLFTGGSTGSATINNAVWGNIESLLNNYNIIHLTGKGKVNKNIKKEGYIQLSYANAEMPHIYNLADIVVCRAGANTLAEILALKKPNLLIPLPLSQSRGDQIENAKSFEAQGFSKVLQEENIKDLKEALDTLYKDRVKYKLAMAETPFKDSVSAIVSVLVFFSEKNIEKNL
ncbi:MAG: undecaprenyldiphospho-muramoylpentapeptide beta-N-acetylglucosaminyltransferase [Defluviitaleaceae bacterium]|nr:undecaprenyldiphospho-muramoylpentapeptide beta-N-acetylglucosaminyltransferase [Defluviitaleaceae bacterium]